MQLARVWQCLLAKDKQDVSNSSVETRLSKTKAATIVIQAVGTLHRQLALYTGSWHSTQAVATLYRQLAL